jgi:uncharacterized protein YkwD
MDPVLLRMLAGAGFVALLPAVALAQRADLARVEKLVRERTDDFRREHGLAGLETDARLEAAARYFAEYMARSDRYGHEADGKEPADRARRHGYDYCMVAENISYQYSSEDFGTAELARRYVEGWKGSPGHRKNMLAPAATDTAVAVRRGEKSGRYYAVQMFGRPRSKSVEFRITNTTRDPVSYTLADRAFSLPPGAGMVHRQCEDSEVVLRSGRAGSGARVTPGNGDRLAVVKEGGIFSVRPAR